MDERAGVRDVFRRLMWRLAWMPVLLAVAVAGTGCTLLEARGQFAAMQGACVLEGHIAGAGEAGKDSDDGAYVVLAVRERGEGLPPEVVDHVLTGSGGQWFFALEPGVWSVLGYWQDGRDAGAVPGAAHAWERGATLDCGVGERYLDQRIRVDDPARRIDGAFDEGGLTFPGAAAERAAHEDDSLPSLGRVTAFGLVTTLADPRFDPAIAAASQWRPLDFVRDGYAGVYFLDGPYDPAREPVLFIHGMNGSPVSFEALVEDLDTRRFQPWAYYYPSGVPLDAAAVHLAQVMEELELRHDLERYQVVAHSMGGLVARGFLLERERRGAPARVPRLVTLATPWGGHRMAATGVAHAPVVVPVWRDMAPGSEFLEGLFAGSAGIPAETHLLFAHRRDSGRSRELTDGVVSLESMLRPEAQAAAASLYGVDATHAGILEHPRTLERVRTLLEGP
ncbi:alpha/beta fold hydrolase [Thioalkalivibrio sp. ALE11]|uniref:alpha/beta fold hydrolase n=1 Tax=Thioalkalivibrio sp. ALE11 TaxID=1265494 RepID=UPI000364C96C|nr:alpha/beta fold hydrolase [Thioalkalivibrio sp. ALE11]